MSHSITPRCVDGWWDVGKIYNIYDMSVNPLELLESDWNTLLADKKWADLGKCLRAIIKIEKNAGQLSHKEYELEKRIKVLEDNLDMMDFKNRLSVVGDILYGRRQIKASATDQYGTAFKRKGI